VLALLLLRPTGVAPDATSPAGAARPLLALAAGFALPTVLWLAPLLLALGGDVRFLGGFTGNVNAAMLFYPPDLPRADGWPLLVLALAALAVVRGGRWRWYGVGAAVPALTALASVARASDQPVGSALVEPGVISVGLVTFLPTVGFWAAWWLCWHAPARRAGSGGLRPWVGPRVDARLRWYLFAGALVFLVEYPRLDPPHLAWSAPVLLVTGVVALDRLHRWLATRWRLDRVRRGALAGALLLMPAFATLPTLYLRTAGLVESDPASGLPRFKPLGALDGVPAAAGVLVAPEVREEYAAVLGAIRRCTEPGSPVFVYPSAPLVYVLADRPNPTRFAHLYPGAASPDELRGVIAALDERAVSLVVVSDYWLGFWGPGAGQNAPLEDHLRATFHEVAHPAPLHLLARSSAGEGAGGGGC
jgi:hypothetical protein